MTTTINASTVSGLIQSADTSGILQLQTANLPAVTVDASQNTTVAGTLTVTGATTLNSSVIRSGTAQPSTSGTSIPFTSIPSWAKRITIMFQGVSTSGTGLLTLQIGTGGVAEITGYTGGGLTMQNNNSYSSYAYATSSFQLESSASTNLYAKHGKIVLDLYGSNTWYESHNVFVWTTTAMTATYSGTSGSGFKTLAGALDMIRLTTSNGTDTFDNGSINISYE
jgi:hypothetical protein